MRPITSPLPSAISLAVAGMLLQGIATSASAQAPLQPTAQESQLPATTVTAQPPRSGRTDIAGWGPEPAWQQPAQAERFSDEAWKQAQVQRLADLIKLDASTSASYNAGGYWDFLSVRGFVLDVTHNYRREGLPISGETSIPLDNKAAVELLKGTSGMQAGVSSPGGLMNLIVKRPEGRTRDATLAFTGNGSILTSVDLGERFGQDKAFGLRVNAAHEHLHPSVQHAQGERHLLAWAADWRVKPGTLVEAEMEFSRRHQRSTAAFSLLDQQVPRPDSIDPDINLNNQAWAQPVMMKGVTGTVRLSHALSDDWKLVGTLGMQRLKADDRMAFPYGGTLCVDPVYLYCDRFSPTGEFDLYDFRSENESRVTDTADVYASGKVQLGSSTHQLSVGAMRSLTRVDVPLAAFAWAGTGNITGDYTTPPNPTFDSAQNLRSERSTELYVRDSIAFTEDWRAWAGLRHTRLSRAQTPSNFTQGTSHAHENLTTPWLALGYQFAPQHQAYVSWGEGVELLLAKFSTPFVTYANSGLVLPAVKSRQWEMGIKAQQGQSHWSVNLFWIKKPEASTLPADATTVRFSVDGDARHQGLEGRFGTRVQNYTLEMSAIVMDAERRRSAKAGINGKAPTNVPDYALKMSHGWRLPALPGLTLQGDIVHEGPRTADAVNDIRIPAWTRLDASAAYVQALGQDRAITWRAGVTNVLDTRAWVESPTQFDHIYLFPMAQRTATLSMQLSF